jgi:hypothetical protein
MFLHNYILAEADWSKPWTTINVKLGSAVPFEPAALRSGTPFPIRIIFLGIQFDGGRHAVKLSVENPYARREYIYTLTFRGSQRIRIGMYTIHLMRIGRDDNSLDIAMPPTIK